MRTLSGNTKVFGATKTLVSIVMVVFNGRDFVEESIKSVLNQSYQNIELVIIDGGSTDGTVDIIRSYEQKLHYWISEKDKGQSDAFIKGFKQCRGEWLTWLNADDLLLPNAIEELVHNSQKYPKVECFTGNIIWVDKQGKIIKCRKGEKWFNFLPRNGYLNVYGPTTFFKATLYESVKGFNKILHYQMDTDLWWQFFNKSASFKRLKSYTWVLRVHENAKTTAQYFSTAEQSSPSHKSRVDMKLEKLYIHRTQFVKKTFLGKFLLYLLRAFSLRYISSHLDEIIYKNKNYQILIKELE